jgi:hypothetical protein
MRGAFNEGKHAFPPKQEAHHDHPEEDDAEWD